jgi:hypothetical protein
LDSPRQFTREHVVYKNEYGRTVRLSELFPLPVGKTDDHRRSAEMR